MHWGVEYKYDANGYQEDAAKYLESLGVDIIIGTHPHVIEPITYINDTLVIYSLGNFISAHEVVNMGNRIGLMSSLDVTLDNNKITISNLNNELLYMYYTLNVTASFVFLMFYLLRVHFNALVGNCVSQVILVFKYFSA